MDWVMKQSQIWNKWTDLWIVIRTNNSNKKTRPIQRRERDDSLEDNGEKKWKDQI